MIIDAFQIATDGVGPGFTPLSFALNGFGYDISIEVIPPHYGTGGGGGRSLPYADPYYTIKVRVSYKGQTWEDAKQVNGLIGKSLEKIVISFKKSKTTAITLVASINKVWKNNTIVKTWFNK